MLDGLYGDMSIGERWIAVLAIGLAVGLVLGIFMRRESIKRQPIHGGMPAQLFHYLAASTISGMVPVIFIALFSELNFFRIAGSGIIFSASTLILLTVYGFFENQAGYVEVTPARELD